MEKRLFGLTEEQIKRQSGNTHAVDPEHKMKPINPNDGFLEPCIRGSQKILSDPEKRDMLYRIYRGKKKSFIERLTDEQIVTYLEMVYTKMYFVAYTRSESHIYVSVNENNSDSIFNFTLNEFDSLGYALPGEWIKYLYRVFGEEYKQAYLAECAKIFD